MKFLMQYLNYVNLFGRYLKYLKTWRLHRETVKQLNRLTNRELKDIGLNRGDINRLIWLDEDIKSRGGE
jgi:uncharacterized protein YjiS (DUF1127 family)